jgi:hypothetical protein
MVKLILKLAVLLLVANGLYQAVPPFYNNWKFQDALKELATYPGFEPTTAMVLDKCERIAHDHNLDLTRDDFVVRLGVKGKTPTVIDTQYSVTLKHIPGHPQPHTFVVHVEGDPARFGSLTP